MKLGEMSGFSQDEVVIELSDEEANAVLGGMLLPAIQKVRDAASRAGVYVATGDVDGDGRD